MTGGMTEIIAPLNRRQLLGLTATGIAIAAAPALAAAPTPMTTYRSRTCGCCMKWVDAMRRAGFAVTVRESNDMAAVKQRLKVPEAVYSCHTTVVGGLVVEGHVPAQAVRTLLARKPKGVIGISAPGMPRGSPGMETADGAKDPLNLTLFDAAGKTRRFV
jgi:hypothetical protein